MKRIIISLLIVSLLNLVGCFYMEQMNPGEVNFAENPDIRVTTKDTPYKINGDDYYYNNDTSTTIKYSIPNKSLVTLRIYDILGSEIETFVNEEKPAGNYEVDFNATELSSGMYLYQLRPGNFVETKKMLLLK
jgi:hypothetical protein